MDWDADDDCGDRDFEPQYCDSCGGFLGQRCNHCSAWYDGGDHMAAQPELWCRCADETARAAQRAVRHD